MWIFFFLISELWGLAHLAEIQIINGILYSKMQEVCEVFLCSQPDRCISEQVGMSLYAFCFTGELQDKHGLFMLPIHQDF